METIRFDELELNPKILRGIKDMGFEEATPIQAQGIPAVLSGRDVIGQAQTGTGKTAALVFRCLRALMHQVTRHRLSSSLLQGSLPSRWQMKSGACKIYAWREGASGIRRTGYQPPD